MYALIKMYPEIVRALELQPMNRRGGALGGIVFTILAVIGLMVVLSAVF